MLLILFEAAKVADNIIKLINRLIKIMIIYFQTP